MKKSYLFVFGVYLILSGCAGKGDGGLVFQTFKDALSSPEDFSLSAQQLADFPYAVSYMQVGNGPQAVVVLAKASDHERLWVSHYHEGIVTRFGRVIRTDGLVKDNIEQVHFDYEDPLAQGLARFQSTSEPVKATGFIDIMPNYRFGIPFKAIYHLKSTQKVLIGDKELMLTQVDEDFSVPSLGFYTVNHYWLNNKGLVLKSQQQYVPYLPPFKITLLKPYQQDVQ